LDIRAMIMAAGIGTRLEPLTLCKPKPLVPVANVAVMEHILNILKNHGIKEVICNTHYLADQMKSYLDSQPVKNLQINHIHEEKLSGTAGGVKKCEYFLNKGQTFIVMSSDSLTDIDLQSLLKRHQDSGAIASMALKAVPQSEVIHMGVVVTDATGRVLEFQEKPPVEEAKSNLVNTGIYIFEPEIFNYIEANTFYDFAKQVFPALMQDNKPLYGFEIKEYWNDIGTLNQYLLSSYDVLERKVKVNIPGKEFDHGWIGNNTNTGQNVTFKNKVLIGQNCQIEGNNQFKNNVTLGDNCHTRENNTFDGCLLWNNIQTGKNCQFSKCIIGNNVITGNNVTISENSIIADNCQIPDGATIPPGTLIEPNNTYVLQ